MTRGPNWHCASVKAKAESALNFGPTGFTATVSASDWLFLKPLHDAPVMVNAKVSMMKNTCFFIYFYSFIV